jgi:hypothetical protein
MAAVVDWVVMQALLLQKIKKGGRSQEKKDENWKTITKKLMFTARY